MIRINLYASGQKAKKGKHGGSAAAVVPEGGSILILVLLVALTIMLTGTVAGCLFWKANQETGRVQKEMHQADAEFARLTQVKTRYQELEKEQADYKRRVDVIDQLRSNQSGPVALLEMLSDTIDHTDEVWLESMTDDGTAIDLKGSALSIHGVAHLMRNIQDTGYFRSVDIKSSYQDESVKDMQAFMFELVCQKSGAAPRPGKKS
jgi:Tfp pilus assembly protein PilN